MQLIKPQKLSKGDKVATICLANGSAGDDKMLWRYNLAKKRLEDIFGLNVVPTSNSMKGCEFIYRNPKARADDFMEVLKDPEIKAILLNQGGDDAIRIMPYIDFDVIANNPKIFMGFSDATTIHFMFYKSGISSFYGPNVLTTLSEPVLLHDYTSKWINRALFKKDAIGNIEAADKWTSKKINWSLSERWTRKRKLKKNNGYEVLQGKGKVIGHLIGGCIEPLVFMIKGSSIFPQEKHWENSIIFLEAVPYFTTPKLLIHMLRSLAAAGVFKKSCGLIFGKPLNHKYYEEYKRSILQVIRNEEGLDSMPILYNLNFGHTAPITILPYGAMAEIDCDNKAFSILN